MSYTFRVLLVLAVCFQHSVDGLSGPTLSFDNGNFNVSWMYEREGDELHFEVSVKTEGWVGFGFTFTPETMNNYDVVIGGKTRAGTPYLNDFFTVGLTTPVLDLKQSYILDRASKHDGITSLRFHRPRITSDLQDIQFNATTKVFLVWAYNLVDDARDPSSFSMHSRKSHSSELHRLVVDTYPTASTDDNPNIISTSPKPAVATLKPVKALGFRLKINILVISLGTVLSVLV